MSTNLMERYRVMHVQKRSETGRKIKLRWNTPTEVRRSLAKVNNMVANMEITAKEANAIYYSANLILKAIELEKQG